jgi:hypothetical protein
MPEDQSRTYANPRRIARRLGAMIGRPAIFTGRALRTPRVPHTHLQRTRPGVASRFSADQSPETAWLASFSRVRSRTGLSDVAALKPSDLGTRDPHQICLESLFLTASQSVASLRWGTEQSGP